MMGLNYMIQQEHLEVDLVVGLVLEKKNKIVKEHLEVEQEVDLVVDQELEMRNKIVKEHSEAEQEVCLQEVDLELEKSYMILEERLEVEVVVVPLVAAVLLMVELEVVQLDSDQVVVQ